MSVDIGVPGRCIHGRLKEQPKSTQSNGLQFYGGAGRSHLGTSVGDLPFRRLSDTTLEQFNAR
jgi:hypothetical protein